MDHTRNTWSIEVRIAVQNTMGREDGKSNDGVLLLVSKCNKKSFLQSKHSIDHVESFLKGYDECTTKAEKVRYCKELGDQCIPLRVLNIDDDELTKAVLQFCPLPRVDADAQEFLPIEECERLLENGDDLATELKDLRRIRKEAEKVDKKSEENEAKKVEMIWSKRTSIGQRFVAF